MMLCAFDSASVMFGNNKRQCVWFFPIQWKQALSQFCDDEYGIKTAVYECCESRDETRWTCFDRVPPNPDYNPTLGNNALSIPQEPGFTFDATACLPQIQI